MGETLILMYHRVTELHEDPWALAVAPDLFADQLAVIQARYDVVPLHDALGRAGRSARPRIVLTFDDGYADNLAAARMLAARGIAATYFLVAGQLGTPREFWWDELTHIFLTSPTLPEKLDLNLDSAKLQLDLSNRSELGGLSDDHTWRAGQVPRTIRQRAYLTSWSVLGELDHEHRERVLQALADWACVSREPRVGMRALTLEEAAELSALGGAEIGAHTMTHSGLALLPVDRQREEIVGSRRLLEEVTGAAVDSFAYPYGSYTADTVEIVSDAGLRFACATVTGPVRPGVSALELPRMMVADWDGAELERRITQVFRQPRGHALRTASRQLKSWYRR